MIIVERDVSQITRPCNGTFPFCGVSTVKKLEILSPEDWEM